MLCIEIMHKKFIATLFFIFIVVSFVIAGEDIDLNQLTSECVEAAKHFKKIKKSISYKVLHTVEYEGWSGDSNTFSLKYPIGMIIRYAGVEKTGYYWFKHDPQKKYNISAKVDFEGNYELIEIIEGGFEKYQFRGKMHGGIIKGLWEIEHGQKAFAFYVEIKK